MYIHDDGSLVQLPEYYKIFKRNPKIYKVELYSTRKWTVDVLPGLVCYVLLTAGYTARKRVCVA